MTRAYRLPCGCKSNDTHWLEMCATHRGEFDEIHHRAQAEHQQNTWIKDDNARVSPPQSSPMVAPTAGGVTVPGVPFSMEAS